MVLNSDILVGRVNVRTYVRSSATKCAIIYYEQTAGHRSAIFYTDMHVDKIRSPANFDLNSQHT